MDNFMPRKLLTEDNVPTDSIANLYNFCDLTWTDSPIDDTGTGSDDDDEQKTHMSTGQWI